MQFNVETKAMSDGSILQEVKSDCGLMNTWETMSRQLMHAQDEGIKAALVSMGWIAPMSVHDLRKMVSQINDLMVVGGATLTERQEDVLYAALKTLLEREEA